MSFPYLTAIIFLPVVGAIVIAVIPGLQDRVILPAGGKLPTGGNSPQIPPYRRDRHGAIPWPTV